MRDLKQIINGEFRSHDVWDDDRLIELPNVTLMLQRTKDGGWRENGLDAQNPDGGGSSGGIEFAHFAKHHPWFVDRLWRRIIELEDERRLLRAAIRSGKP